MVLPQLFFLRKRHFLYRKSCTSLGTDGRLLPTPPSAHQWANFETSKNHPSWGVFRHKKLGKIFRVTWFYPNFFFLENVIFYIGRVAQVWVLTGAPPHTPTPPSAHQWANFETSKNHPSWGVFWHKKLGKIFRVKWFYPNFFFLEIDIFYIGRVPQVWVLTGGSSPHPQVHISEQISKPAKITRHGEFFGIKSSEKYLG
jgi:hypothetical protein